MACDIVSLSLLEPLMYSYSYSQFTEDVMEGLGFESVWPEPIHAHLGTMARS